MLRMRFQRKGRKRQPVYRLVIIEDASRRNGRTVDEIGFYNPITKNFQLSFEKVNQWLRIGVRPTKSVNSLLDRPEIFIAALTSKFI